MGTGMFDGLIMNLIIGCVVVGFLVGATCVGVGFGAKRITDKYHIRVERK